VKGFCKVLPLCLKDLTNVLVVKRGTPENYNHFILNKRKVLNALIWLQQNNPFYKDIIINMNNLKDHPEISNVYEYFSVIDDEYTINSNENTDNLEEDDEEQQFLSDSNVPNIDIFDPLSKINQILGFDWPKNEIEPVNEFEDTILCKAFPHLFPIGMKLKFIVILKFLLIIY
jgi:hypothetical protein